MGAACAADRVEVETTEGEEDADVQFGVLKEALRLGDVPLQVKTLERLYTFRGVNALGQARFTVEVTNKSKSWSMQFASGSSSKVDLEMEIREYYDGRPAADWLPLMTTVEKTVTERMLNRNKDLRFDNDVQVSAGKIFRDRILETAASTTRDFNEKADLLLRCLESTELAVKAVAMKIVEGIGHLGFSEADDPCDSRRRFVVAFGLRGGLGALLAIASSSSILPGGSNEMSMTALKCLEVLFRAHENRTGLRHISGLKAIAVLCSCGELPKQHVALNLLIKAADVPNRMSLLQTGSLRLLITIASSCTHQGFFKSYKSGLQRENFRLLLVILSEITSDRFNRRAFADMQVSWSGQSVSALDVVLSLLCFMLPQATWRAAAKAGGVTDPVPADGAWEEDGDEDVIESNILLLLARTVAQLADCHENRGYFFRGIPCCLAKQLVMHQQLQQIKNETFR